MKHIAVAIIVVALITADFCSDLWMNGTDDNTAWAYADTVGLICAGLWFYHHRNRMD